MQKKNLLYTPLKTVSRFLVDCLQSLILLALFLGLQLLPFKTVSALGGRLGRFIGARIPQKKRAYANLKRAMPELSLEKQHAIIDGMFDNLGRTFLEYAVLWRLKKSSSAPSSGGHPYIEVVGEEIIQHLRDDQKPAILFLAHLAHWEMGTLAGLQRGLKISQVYRRLNYPLIDRVVHWIHRRVAQEVLPKGAQGARLILSALQKGTHVSLLSDQKMDEGMMIPFFGIKAKTATAPARLSLKYGCPFVPVRVERLPNATFRVTYYPPLMSQKKSDQEQIMDLLTQMNCLIESWVRARPEQWFWLHHRWGKGFISSK